MSKNLDYTGKLDCSSIYKAILSSKSLNSYKSYMSSFNQWKKFALINDIEVFPVNKVEFSIFLIDWVDKGGSWSSLNGSISAVKFFMDLFSFDFQIPKSNHIELYLKKNCKKISNKKRPLLKSEVDKILNSHFENRLSLKICRDLCLILFGFYGFLRYDDMSQLKLVDIELINDVINIHVANAKNDRYRTGQNLKIKCSKDWLIIFKTFLALTEKCFSKFENDVVFLFPSMSKDGRMFPTKKISYRDARMSILSLCKAGGIDIDRVGTHSLRIGGCTEASRRGIPNYVLEGHGRWSYNSRSRAMYQRVEDQEFLWVSEVLMND